MNDGDRSIGNVVGDAHGEVVLRLFAPEILVNRAHHRRVEFLRAKAVSAAVNADIASIRFGERRANVEVKRFAERACFLGAVEYRDLLDGSGDSVYEVLDGERTVKSDLKQADFLTLFCEIVDGFFGGFAPRSHHYDDFFRVRIAVVLIEFVFSASELGDFRHHFFYDTGNGFVILVGGFAVLEVDIAVLRGAHLHGMLGVKRAGFETLYVLHIDEGKNLVVLDAVDLADFVAGSETVEEVQERHGSLQGREVRYEREVHNFLNGVRCQHRKTGLTASHNVRVIAENVKSVSRERTGADVEHGRPEFAGDLVHIRDHQQ